MFRELLHRRVPQFLIAYFVAGWGLVQFLQFLEQRYALSPAWVDLLGLAWLLLLPGIVVLAWSQGAPGHDRWTRRQLTSIAINLVAATVIIGILFADRDLGAVTTTITVHDENGQELTRKVPKSDYRRSLSLFFVDDHTGDAEQAWKVDAVAYLLELDLFQDLFIDVRSAFQNQTEAQRAGIASVRDLPFALRRQLAARRDSSFFLDGTLGMDDDQLALTLSLRETRTGQEVDEAVFRGGLFEVCDQASVWLRESMEIPTSHIESNVDLPVAELATESLPALRSFLRGVFGIAQDNDYEAAAPHLEAAVDVDPTFCLAHLARYQVLSFRQDQARSMEAIDAAMQHVYRVPERMQFVIKSNYYGAQQQFDKMMSVLELWTRLLPTDVLVHRLLAQQYRYRGEPDRSIASHERILELLPDDGPALDGLAELYESRGDLEAAEGIYRRLTDLNPRESAPLVSLALCFEAQGKLDEAAVAYEEAATLEPDNVSVQRRIALLSAKLGDLEGAEKELRRLVEVSRSAADRSQALDSLRALLAVRGRFGEAVALHDAWEEAASKVTNPAELAIRNSIELALFARAGRAEEGLERIAAVRSKMGAGLERFTSIGSVALYLELEDAPNARNHLTEVVSVVEEFGLASLDPVIDSFEAQILEIEGDFAGAVELQRSSLVNSDPRPGRFVDLGRMERKAGHLEDSEKTLGKALRLSPANAEAHHELALTLVELGRGADALADLDRALEVWNGADPTFAAPVHARRLREELSQGS